MNKPEMIIFDYGETLIYEPDFTPHNGNAAIFPYLDNSRGVTLDEFSDYLITLFDDIRALRGELIEIHEFPFLRLVLEHFGMSLTIPFEEAEWIMWNGVSPGAVTPGADKMLRELRQRGIRTAVISNLCWSGKSLKRRFKKFFPDHDFDFIITSSDYIFRKPDRHLFDLAVSKADIPREKIWFCGNDVKVDVMGAHGAGIFPVLYEDMTFPHRTGAHNADIPIDFPCLRISNYTELINAL